MTPLEWAILAATAAIVGAAAWGIRNHDATVYADMADERRHQRPLTQSRPAPPSCSVRNAKHASTPGARGRSRR